MMDLDLIPEDILEDVRMRMGEDMDSEMADDAIRRMSPDDFASHYLAWHIGDESWGRMFLEAQRAAERALVD